MPLTDALLAEYQVTPREIEVSLGVTREAVRLWRRDQRAISPEVALLIEKRFGIPKHRMRPDIWDAPPKKSGSADRPQPAI